MSRSRSRLAADWFARLRFNLTNNIVETDADADIAQLEADKAQLEADLAAQAAQAAADIAAAKAAAEAKAAADLAAAQAQAAADLAAAQAQAAADAAAAQAAAEATAATNLTTTVSNYALKDFSNVTTLPANIVTQLKGADGIDGVSPTFTFASGVLTITTP